METLFSPLYSPRIIILGVGKPTIICQKFFIYRVSEMRYEIFVALFQIPFVSHIQAYTVYICKCMQMNIR